MKILALQGSPRKRGNTNRVLDEMIKGAEDNGHEVKKYFLQGLDINPAAVVKSVLKVRTADLMMMVLKLSTSWRKVLV
ncbi:MAG: flavodoxin family protein [Methanobrevibacter sp.]|uniref:NAD(P)H-dependent oxidoreductase n=1 Tax=Methanobrevibacter sp. TaxID=66852 RepID=UPI001B7C98BE|nr:NAD(P)H-dependent oxidoreductase [Methanobrevibacter sp.]MBP3791666.1 flavodoxin family protein [Methanobrevibacter sp.]